MNNQEVDLSKVDECVENECVKNECVKNECEKNECVNNESNTIPELKNMLSNLDEIFKGNDDLLNNLKNIDMVEMQNHMTMMMESLQKSDDPNILSMLNLMNNLSISNLTNSQFSLGDSVQEDFSNEKLVEDDSDSSDENDKKDEDEESEESEESEPDEDLLSYLKDKEDNQEMIINVKKMLENIHGTKN
jgi:hypothetical protein